ncbi:hypothetical protein LSTR_LSTR008503 [Laodelphax striatellus]|uniref:Uncharacterized protein n=1 Tax=Laodelphax striatellus TaxID=195883 RepID=A0A482WQY6_LAOST|nr:hypothetical protein LSTR_LSTR008503 [Laodelphax striatellus]
MAFRRPARKDHLYKPFGRRKCVKPRLTAQYNGERYVEKASLSNMRKWKGRYEKQGRASKGCRDTCCWLIKGLIKRALCTEHPASQPQRTVFVALV